MRFYNYLAIAFVSFIFVMFLLMGQHENRAAIPNYAAAEPLQEAEITEMVADIQIEQRQLKVAFKELNDTMSAINNGIR
jgi:hypothetical protein